MYPHLDSHTQSGEPGRTGACVNRPVQEMGQPLEYEDWVTQLKPLLRRTFEAGVQGGSQLLQGQAVTGSHRGSVMMGSQRDGQMRCDPVQS